MKVFKFQFLLLGLVALLSVTTSCKKDNDNDLGNADTLVGTWNVSDGDAVGYIEGYTVQMDIGTSGTLKFDEDGSGLADFALTFEGETQIAKGPFTWERDGFELVVDEAGDIIRWAMVDDEKDLKTIQYTEDIEEGEIEFTLTLTRRD